LVNIFKCIFLIISKLKIYSWNREIELLNDPAFDKRSSCLIRLNNGTILYLKEVCSFLALVCILREDNFEKQSEHNYFNDVYLIFHIMYHLIFIYRNYRL